MYKDVELTQFDFYPRPPRGGRLTYALIGSALISFLSTPSARRATSKVYQKEQ